MIFVTSYIGPDMDGTACAIAYAELMNRLGVEAEAAIMGEPTVEAVFVLNILSVSSFLKREKFKVTDKIVLLDASEARFFVGRLAPEQVIEVIDHRMVNEAEKFVNAKIQIEMVGAAATLVAERFREANIMPSETSARLLQAAIISNTQNFQSKTTTEQDHNMMKWLDELAPLPDGFVHKMFEAKSDFVGDKLAIAMDAEAGSNVMNGKTVSCVQLEMIGSAVLVRDRKNEIIEILSRMKTENGYDYIYASFLDIEEKVNRILCDDMSFQSFLSKALDINFENGLALRNEIIMRKEITPLLKIVLETL
ncbi:MAG: DHH family phosphoesterase [Patescibacteria group bacterium]